MGAKYPWLVAKSCKDLVLSSRVNGTITTPDRAAGPRDAEAFRLHAELCKVFTDPKRLMVLEALRAGECSVGELADGVGMSLPNASQHLSVLRHAGLVATRREGTTVFYSLAEPRIAQACDIVHQIVLDRMPETGSHRPYQVAEAVTAVADKGAS
jgi:ArsR family transcriptional regulator